MTETSDIILDTARKIFVDLAEPQTINQSSDTNWQKPLWQALESNGLTLAWVPENRGGSGIEMADGFGIVRVAGESAVPIALTETLIAGWLLDSAGISCPNGPISVSSNADTNLQIKDGKLSGTVPAVPFADSVDTLAVLISSDERSLVALVDVDSCRCQPIRSISDDSLATVHLDKVEPLVLAETETTADILFLFGAVVRTVLIAGAMEKILDLSVNYSQERVAFGKPIAGFQAIQHSLADLGCEAAAAAAVSSSAVDALVTEGARMSDELLLEVASAKIRCGEAANKAAAIAHQVHGAIGFTAEHVLHQYTRRLWAWRDQFGDESYWADRLGRRVAELGSEQLWPLVASR